MNKQENPNKNPEKARLDDFYLGGPFYNVKSVADKDYTALEPTPPMREEEMEEARKRYELPKEDSEQV